MTDRERGFLSGILPADRKGYTRYREQIRDMVVIGEGRRGNGEIILGIGDDTPSFDDPLAPVFAYGAIETNFGTISITGREVFQNQCSIEIVNSKSDFLPPEFEESRRWTYSTWLPDTGCPQCLQRVREVRIQTSGMQRFTLAICPGDKRLWVYEEEQQVVRLIPITNFYNELMLAKNIRDPKIALQSALFFTELQQYSDKDLLQAFFTYNKLKTKVHIQGEVLTPNEQPAGILSTLKRIVTSWKS